MKPLVVLAGVLTLSTALRALAEAPTLSGRWSASPMRVAWSIGDWGSACGPRPSEAGAPAGTATVMARGQEITIVESSRSYSTSQCWEQYPGLRVVSHQGGPRGWRTLCKTASNDPRQATVTTTINASDTDLVFDEAGQYQFVVGGQNCTASVRRSRSFHLLQREGEPSPAAAPSAVASTPTPARAADTAPERAPQPVGCQGSGSPARLEIGPSRKLLRPGEEFQFRTRVLDGQGCALNVSAVWTVLGNRTDLKLVGAGRVRVSESAQEGELGLAAAVEGQSARVMVEVVSRERYEALLGVGRFDRKGETREVSVALIASQSIGTRAAVWEDTARARRRMFVKVVGGLLFLVGIPMVAVYVRRRARPTAGSGPGSTEASPPPPRSEAMVCPSCARVYPLGTEFCRADGEHLVCQAPCGQRFDPAVSASPERGAAVAPRTLPEEGLGAAAELGKKICPVCGTQYPADALFCGTDGANLVPLN